MLRHVSVVALLHVLGKMAFAKCVNLPRRNNRLSTDCLRGGSVDARVLRKFSEDSRMPSLFASHDVMYDRYAACLAATEGLRRIRDRDLLVKNNNAIAVEDAVERERIIAKEYVQNSGKVLRAMGLTVSQFNELGKTISKDDGLRERVSTVECGVYVSHMQYTIKLDSLSTQTELTHQPSSHYALQVMEQAYLYRMAATINMDRLPLIEDDTRSNKGIVEAGFQIDKMKMFCESMTEIEKLRENQIERLKRSLQVDSFPANINISDPGLLPFLSPKVRAVVEAFPYQAEEIVKKHGLVSEEFNQMLSETKSNPMFRWKIQKQIRKGEPKLIKNQVERAQETLVGFNQ
jgi:hypothetical protein